MGVTLHDPDLPRKFLMRPDLAMGEAYLDGRLTLRDDDIRFVRAMHPATHRLDPSPRALRAQTALGDPRAAADQGVDTEARLPAHR